MKLLILVTGAKVSWMTNLSALGIRGRRRMRTVRLLRTQSRVTTGMICLTMVETCCKLLKTAMK